MRFCSEPLRRLLDLRYSHYPSLVPITNPERVAIHPLDWEIAKESVPRAAELLSDVLLNNGIDTKEFLVIAHAFSACRPRVDVQFRLGYRQIEKGIYQEADIQLEISKDEMTSLFEIDEPRLFRSPLATRLAADGTVENMDPVIEEDVGFGTSILCEALVEACARPPDILDLADFLNELPVATEISYAWARKSQAAIALKYAKRHTIPSDASRRVSKN
jgi:hypothetical protein